MPTWIHPVAGWVLTTPSLLLLLWGCAARPQTPEPLLPGVAVARKTGVVQLDGEVAIERGILEYVAVARGGKEYESVFRVNCRPSHVQMALLIAGCQPGSLADEARGDFGAAGEAATAGRPPEAPRVPRAPPSADTDVASRPTCVTIDVDVLDPNGTWLRRPIESFLIDRRTASAPRRLTWAFTGSFFQRDAEVGSEYFVADWEKSIIALWYDPTALLNLTADVGNPYRGDASGLEVNPATMPRKGTPVRLIIRPVTPAAR